jgi:hypothetical protein
MSDFVLNFDNTSFDELDKFALLVRQDRNLGNPGSWFGTFRGGLYGFYARLYGIVVHYRTVHAWAPSMRSPTETEYHLATIFFNMDSAIECLSFALNALGYAASPGFFRDVSNARALRQISPKDILGDPSSNPSVLPVSGYGTVFPQLQSLWQSERSLLDRIVEQHDVSKHRQTIFVGGRARSDPPIGFYESLGIPDTPKIRAQFWPMAEIKLQNEPRLPRAARMPQSAESFVYLETVSEEFVQFINRTGEAALKDAQAKIVI